VNARRASRLRACSIRGALVPSWLVAVACLVALLLAARAPEAEAEPSSPSSARAPSSASANAVAPLPHEAHQRGGLTPLPDDAEVPLAWMPPGSAASPLPSEAIFPPQTVTLRFNHKKHVKDLGQGCKTCHASAYASVSASDRLLPRPADTCDKCHDADHKDLAHVTAGARADGQCAFCHLGDHAGEDGKVAPTQIPTPNLHFPHRSHLARNIQCGQCHGRVAELQLATRAELPRMAGCLACHGMSGAAAGEAKGTCTTCHLAEPDGRMRTSLAGVALVPPRWLHGADHTPDWIERHKSVAADDSAFCGSCHKDRYCADCHDGRVRPRRVHPNDWLSMHPEAARQDNPRCTSCHAEPRFCLDCHMRAGVARDAPIGNRVAGRRFHPPPSVWTTAPRGPMHHAWEATRNLNACVSCHTERDCSTCHATKGPSGGQGIDPHPSGFRDRCALALQRNPRPCFVCHQPRDAALGSCR
jgi:Cytochrome c7 and related cytochrome c